MKTSSWNNIAYILRIAWNTDRAGLLWMLVHAFYSALPTAVSVLLVKSIIDAVDSNASFTYIICIVLIATTIKIVEITITLSVSSLRSKKTEMLIKKKLTLTLLERIQRIDAKEYDNPAFYDNLLKAADEAESGAMEMLRTVQSILQSVITLLVSASIIVTLKPLLVFISILSGLLSYWLSYRYNRVAFQHNNEYIVRSKATKYFKSLFFNRESTTEFKQYEGLGRLILRRYAESLDGQYLIEREMNKNQNKHMGRLLVINYLTSNTAPYLYAGIEVIKKAVSISDMTMMISAAAKISASINSVLQQVGNLQMQCLYVDNLKTVLDYFPEIEKKSGIPLTAGMISKIEFKHVYFRYPNKKDYALKNINLSISKGEKIAIVGLNGSGKTTLVKLLLRFYDPQEGGIFINGVNLKAYDISAVRRVLPSVFQDFQLYSLKLAELISCDHCNELDTKRVFDAMANVGLSDIVSQEKGIFSEYGRYFDPEGITLSGGEAQKLMIARMIYNSGDVLIMDEPTASLDPKSEIEINKEIIRISDKRTLILISHRLSSTKNMDKIIMLDRGEIVEQGSHRELIEKMGRYAALFSMQAAEYSDSDL